MVNTYNFAASFQPPNHCAGLSQTRQMKSKIITSQASFIKIEHSFSSGRPHSQLQWYLCKNPATIWDILYAAWMLPYMLWMQIGETALDYLQLLHCKPLCNPTSQLLLLGCTWLNALCFTCMTWKAGDIPRTQKYIFFKEKLAAPWSSNNVSVSCSSQMINRDFGHVHVVDSYNCGQRYVTSISWSYVQFNKVTANS